MKLWGWPIVICIIAPIAVATMPFCFGWVIESGKFQIGEYGSWLQGTLTPIAIIVAMYAVHQQSKSQAETNANQSKANKQLLMGLMLDNLPKFEKHLNHMAHAAIWESQPAAELIEESAESGAPLQFVERLLEKPDDARPGPCRDKLLYDLKRVIELAEASDTLSFLDRRIADLLKKLEAPDTSRQGSSSLSSA